MRRLQGQAKLAVTVAVLGVILLLGSLIVPTLLLIQLDDDDLNRWSDIGQAVSPVGVFFSGAAFIGIALTLFLQGRELTNQGEELALAREELVRSSELATRQLHIDLIKMAIDDPELRSVWPAPIPGQETTRKDHYCNLVLNLQKIAYITKTIELDELRGALRFLMTSPDMRAFWAKSRAARIAVTGGDEAEDFFTGEVDRAYVETAPPPPQP